MARKNQMFRCTCSVCGQPFFASRVGALYDSNKCKQVAYRKAKLERIKAQKLTLPMESYSLFQQIADRNPELVQPLTSILIDYDQELFNRVLSLVSLAQIGVTRHE